MKTEKMKWDIAGVLRTEHGSVIRTVRVGSFDIDPIKNRIKTENFLLKTKQQWLDNTRYFDDTHLVIVMNSFHGKI